MMGLTGRSIQWVCLLTQGKLRSYSRRAAEALPHALFALACLAATWPQTVGAAARESTFNIVLLYVPAIATFLTLQPTTTTSAAAAPLASKGAGEGKVGSAGLDPSIRAHIDQVRDESDPSRPSSRETPREPRDDGRCTSFIYR